MKAKHKKYLLNILKVLIFGFLAFMIYWQLEHKSETNNLFENFLEHFSWSRAPFLVIAILLMPVNWFLESIKWKTFVSRFQKSFPIEYAVQSILCGSLFGFLTPNRIGEFGGRLYRIEKENRGRALTAGYWGGIAQFTVTFGLGIYMGGRTILNYVDVKWVQGFTIPLAFALITVTVFIFFNLKWLIQKIQNFPIVSKLTKKYKLDFDMPKSSLMVVLLITIMRYVVYVNQYVYLLFFFGIELDYFVLFSSVSTMLVLHTCIPSVPFVDIVVKQNALLIILQTLTNNELAVLLAVAVIWIINIVTPAIAGYYYFSKINPEDKMEMGYTG